MAYVNGRWLGYSERAEKIEEYEEEASLLGRLVRLGNASNTDLSRLEYLLDEIERMKRVHRGEHDVLYFGMTYFSEDGNPDNPDNLIPAGVNVDNAADFHKELTGMLDAVSLNRVKRHIAWACPRRHAKTAWLSNIFLLHQITYRHRRYIVLFSETTDVAGDFITWGRYQLKLNEKLREDFGELLYVKPSMNDLDNKYEFITTSNTKVEAKGLGTQTRGLRHGSTRPDMFILDDLESDETTNTSDLIEKSKTWFREEMLPAMSKEGLCIYLGTILCYGSLLHHVIEDRKDFESRKFAAVESYSNREDLWKEWRNIYRADDSDSTDNALEFYEEHEDEMLDGVKILWPGYWSYYELICIRENDGIKAFNQEYQNNPTDEERQIFKPEYFTWFDEEELAEKNIKFYAGVDMALGKEKGDYSVIATIAKNEDTGVCYLYDVFMERCHPDVLLNKAVELTLRYQYEGIAAEAQQFQEWFAYKLGEELRNKGYPSDTRLKPIKQRTRKALRIESLLPDIQNGRLRFNRTIPADSMAQFELYPMHKHDDFPDACEMAYRVAKEGHAIFRTLKKRAR